MPWEDRQFPMVGLPEIEIRLLTRNRLRLSCRRRLSASDNPALGKLGPRRGEAHRAVSNQLADSQILTCR
jgi:hypothetical protein